MHPDEVPFPEGDGFLEFKSLQTISLCLGWPKKPQAARHRIIRLPPEVCTGDGGRGATCTGPVARPGYVCARCEHNVVNSFCLRHGAEPPPVTEDWNHSYAFWDRFIVERPWLHSDLVYGDFGLWMDRWSSAKRLAILRSLMLDPLLPSTLKVMPKLECHHEYPTKGRLIQFYPNLATQAEFGPMFVALQKAVFGWVLDRPYRGVRVTFSSGLPASGIAKWMDEVLERFPKPYFYERDGKNWDSCMVDFHHKLRMRIYRAFSPKLAAFVDAGFAATGVVHFPDGVFKYFINGTNKSGHNDTSLYNSIINASIALEALVRLGIEAEIIVAGDDLLVVAGCDLSGMADIERGFGIIPTFRVFRDPLEVSFISGCWLPSASGWMFVPKLGRLLARLWWTCYPPGGKKVDAYRAGVVRGLQHAIGTIPLYRDFVRAKDVPPMELGKDFNYWVASFGGAQADTVTRDAMCRKYDMYPSEIEQLGRFLASLPFGPCTMKHHLIDRILSVDLADPMVRPLCSA